jgi:hypothetical protein
MTDQFTFDAAPYVLGALSPEDRQAFEAHLAECPACESQVREFAGLPGLLSRLPGDEVAAALAGGVPQPPPDMLPALQFTVRRERRTRRRRVFAAGLAAACLAVIGTAVVLDQTGTGVGSGTGTAPPVVAAPPTLSFRTVGTVPVTATASVVGKAWGTEIDMKCTYVGPVVDGSEPQYTLVALDRAGVQHRIGDWQVLVGKEVHVTMSTGIARSQLSSLRVVNTSNNAVLELNL